MLTADQIEALGDKAQQLITPVTEFLIEDIAGRIAEAGQFTSTAAYQTWRLQLGKRPCGKLRVGTERGNGRFFRYPVSKTYGSVQKR